MFLTETCLAPDLPLPDPATGGAMSDYQFEGPVASAAAFGTKGTHRIDLYRRDHFILEAKQSQLAPGETMPDDPARLPPETVRNLFGNSIGTRAATDTASSAPARHYDRLMADACVQAERLALGLTGDHKAPPFIIVCDVGRAFELYFD